MTNAVTHVCPDGTIKFCPFVLDAKIEESMDDLKSTLSFKAPKQFCEIKNEHIIRFCGETFVAKEVSVKKNNIVEIIATTNLRSFENNTFFEYDFTGTIKEHLDKISSWKKNIKGYTTEKIHIQLKNTNALKIIEKIRDTYACEIRIDTKETTVYVADKIGKDIGACILPGANVSTMELTEDTYDYANRLIPSGKDGLKINTVNSGKNYVDGSKNVTNETITQIWEDNTYEDANVLKRVAELKVNELSETRKTIAARFVDLYAIDKTNFAIFDIAIGDTVYVHHDRAAETGAVRVAKIVRYPNNPAKNTLELSSKLRGFSDMKKKIDAALECVNNVTNGNSIIINTAISGDIAGVEISKPTIDRICV